MTISLNVLLWSFLMAFCIHVIEESTVGGGFVQMMKRNFWREYDGTKFFWFNLSLFSLFAMGVVLFEILQGAWVIWSLSFAFLCVTNGIWHLLQTAILREYSPGLITSPIYWILMYFIIRSNLLTGEINPSRFWVAFAIGTLMTLLMFGSVWSFRRSLPAHRI